MDGQTCPRITYAAVASVCNIGLLNSQDFKKKPLLGGPHWAHVAGTAPTLTCTDLAHSQGKAGNELPWVSDFPVHTHGPLALIRPLCSWASCRTHFRKKVTLLSHSKGGGVWDTVEEASVSVGTRPYWIYSTSEKKTTIVPPLRSWDSLLLKDNLAYLDSGTHYQAHKIIPTCPVPIPHSKLPQYIKSQIFKINFFMIFLKAEYVDGVGEEGGRAE